MTGSGYTYIFTFSVTLSADYYNNGGANGGGSASGGGSPGTNQSGGGGAGSYSSYYSSDSSYTTTPPPAKPPGKKPPMHQGGKPPGTAPGNYQATPPPPGQGGYGQYGQGYGQGKKNFSQSSAGAPGGYSNYSTAYPSQVTGGAGGQDYSYEGEHSVRVLSCKLYWS